MSQLETLGGANQLSYKVFGQLQIKYTLELRNTLVPKLFSPTSIFFILQYIIDCVLTFAFFRKILLLIVFLTQKIL